MNKFNSSFGNKLALKLLVVNPYGDKESYFGTVFVSYITLNVHCPVPGIVELHKKTNCQFGSPLKHHLNSIGA